MAREKAIVASTLTVDDDTEPALDLRIELGFDADRVSRNQVLRALRAATSDLERKVGERYGPVLRGQ